jgi:MFS family permease
MQAIGASVASLGFIEGTADAASSFIKLGAGYHSDKIGRRKPLAVVGYALTAIGIAVFTFAFAWPLLLLGRFVGWLGRGIRGPLRDAMLADSVTAADRGKAFGFHRAGDTAGAVAGPLAAFVLLSIVDLHPAIVRSVTSWLPGLTNAAGWQFRAIFLLTLVPGALSVLAMLLTKEERRSPNHGLRFWRTLRSMPKDYRTFLTAVTLFGMADFAPTLMIMRASTVLAPHMGIIEAARVAALLYTLRNVIYAAASFPIGALSHRFASTRYLAVGYAVAVLTFLGFAFAIPSVWWFVVFFCLAGVFIAWEDTIEGVAVRDYVTKDIAGTAYGALGVANGIGDFASSLIVGVMWTAIGPMAGFLYAAIIGFSGMALMAAAPGRAAERH